MKRLFLTILVVLIVVFLSAQMVKYKVETKKCIGCGICVQSKPCPTNAISLKNGKAVIDQEKCIGCGLCAKGGTAKYNGCPVNAFSSYQVVQKETPAVSSEAKQVEKTPLKDEDKTKTTEKKPEATPTKTEKPKSDTTKVENVIKKVIYYVESATCIGCNLCISQCPTKAITNVKGKAVIDMDKCISCGICKNGNASTGYRGCPVNAIKTK